MKNDIHKTVRACIQCGTCSGSCPLSARMDHAPRELFGLIRDGEMDIVLRSNTPWFCVSCYRCVVRCPREIPVIDLMYQLKQMAIQNKTAPNFKIPHLYQAFVKEVKVRGRINEAILMTRFSFKHPWDALEKLPLARQLLQKGRMSIFPEKEET